VTFGHFMTLFPQKVRRSPAGPPKPVIGVLAAEIVVVIILFAVGVSPGELLASAGPAIAITVAFLTPTVQELGRRQPKLALRAQEADGDGIVRARALPPWPFDAERVVANERVVAQQTVTHDSAARGALHSTMDPLAVRPSPADHEQAREEFAEELDGFESELRAWLSGYAEATRAHSRTLDLTLHVMNAESGAHAEPVTVEVALPVTLEVVEEWPTAEVPPGTPRYQPPRPRSLSTVYEDVLPRPRLELDPMLFRSPPVDAISLRDPQWQLRDGGRTLEATVGDLHAGRAVKVGEPLLLRATETGSHEIRWTVYTRSARRPATGTILVEMPPAAPGRPAFGRLHGITSYADVPLVDAEGEVVHPVRTTDPPLHPPATEEVDGVIAVLEQAGRRWEWEALGLDPATDGPERSRVQRAEPHRGELADEYRD
jgi:hypothetical protein